jgi:hypothetical protein
MKIEVEDAQQYLLIDFDQFLLFYPLFNAGEKVLYYKETDEKFTFLAFIDNNPVVCTKLKSEIIQEANLPDDSPEAKESALEAFRVNNLGKQHPKMRTIPFIRFGEL